MTGGDPIAKVYSFIYYNPGWILLDIGLTLLLKHDSGKKTFQMTPGDKFVTLFYSNPSFLLPKHLTQPYCYPINSPLLDSQHHRFIQLKF